MREGVGEDVGGGNVAVAGGAVFSAEGAGVCPGTDGVQAERSSRTEMTKILVKNGYCFMGHLSALVGGTVIQDFLRPSEEKLSPEGSAGKRWADHVR